MLLAYGAARLLKGPPPTGRLAAIAVLCGVWVAAVLATVLLRRIREALIAKRHHLALCFASTLIALGFCDLGLSVTGIVPTTAEQRAMSLEYRRAVFTRNRLIPKQLTLASGPTLQVNSRGYLGPEIALPKPPGRTRIVFLGGSQVFGVFWSGGVNWPLAAGEILAERGFDVDVVNAGVPSHQTTDSLGKLLTDLWTVEPDVIVVCCTWNDLKYFSDLTPQTPYCDVVPLSGGRDLRIHPQGIDRLLCLSSLYRLVHNKLVVTLAGMADEGWKSKPPVSTMTASALRQFRLDLQMICDLGNNIGAKVALCKQARLPVANSPEQIRREVPYDFNGLPHDELIRAFAACDRVIDEVAAEKHCSVIDLSGPLSGKVKIFDDHIHFSARGARKVAQLTAEGLEPMLAPPTVDP